MTNTTTSELPNPFTPFAFFPPEAAWQTTVFYYTSVGSLAVYIWDFLNNLGNDFKLVTQHRVNLPTIVYLFSRWSTLAYLVTNVILYTAPIGNCRRFGLSTGWIYPVAMGFTTLLFFIRVRAIYNRSNLATGIFFVLWLGVLGGTSTIPLSTRATEIGPTQFCTSSSSNIPPTLNASGLLTLFFDTSVYLAITWRLTRDLHQSRHQSDGGIKTLFTGENLPIFSKALLQDGQIYYLSTTSVSLMATILFNVHSLPLAYRFFLGLPSQVLMNVMACRVYRSTKFGLFNKASVIPTSQMIPTRVEVTSAVTVEWDKTRDRGSADVELGIMSSGKRVQL